MRFAGLLALALFSPVFVHATVVINEIMYDPKGADASAGGEWVEVQNTGSDSTDFTKWIFFENNTNHGITADGSAEIPPGGYAIISSDLSTFKNYFTSFSGLLYKASFSLSDGEKLTIKNGKDDTITDANSVTYSTDWGAKNDGNSLQKNSSNTFEPAAPTPGASNASNSGSSSSGPPPAEIPSDSSSTTTATPSSGGAPPEYIPIPTLRIITGGDRTVSSGADTAFTAVVYDGKGNKRDDALVTWSFGDGMRQTGVSVFHKYYDPGEYLAVVHVTTSSDGGNALAEVVVTVKDASIKISSVSSRGITLLNRDSRTLDLSLWRLSMGGREFKIPEDTQILAGRTILFPSQIIQLPLSDTAALMYPSGEVASTYSLDSVKQPAMSTVSYKRVSEVEPTQSAKVAIPIHEAAAAPTATNDLAAVGAAVPTEAITEEPKSKNLFKSPWFFGLIGVVALAAGAFIFI